MAQTKRKRRKKHRGTQAGTLEDMPVAGAPRARGGSVKQTAAERREQRMNTPPTWRGAVNKAIIAALIFGALVVLLFGREPLQGASLAAVMFLVYIPMTYYTDRFVFARRQRAKAKAAGGRR